MIVHVRGPHRLRAAIVRPGARRPHTPQPDLTGVGVAVCYSRFVTRAYGSRVSSWGPGARTTGTTHIHIRTLVFGKKLMTLQYVLHNARTLHLYTPTTTHSMCRTRKNDTQSASLPL